MRRLYRLDVTEGGERTAVFVIADGVDEVLQAVQDHDTGDIDDESLEPYLEGERRPRAVSGLAKVEPDLHDFVPWGENDDEATVAEFLSGGGDGPED